MNEPIELSNYPKELKTGQFVAVCTHLPCSGNEHWLEGGKALEIDPEANNNAAYFSYSVVCGQCVELDRFTIEFRRAKFYNGKLNFGWWQFETKAYPGRPKAVK